MTNIIASLAYKAIAIQLMLHEVNLVSERLQLPIPHPIQITDIRNPLVSPPKFGFGGTFDVGDYNFRFPHGNLCFIEKYEPAVSPYNYDKLIGIPSLIGDAQAHTLATQWLAAVSIDVVALERRYRPRMSQQKFYYPSGTSNLVSLPIHYVKWGDKEDSPAIDVTILGTNKELIELRIEDASLVGLPTLVVTNALELNRIPDPPTQHLQLQK